MTALFQLDSSAGVYIITSPSGKVRIGQTKDFNQRFAGYRSDAKTGRAGNCKYFSRAVAKYGWKAMSILTIPLLPKDWTPAECFLIHIFNATNPRFGYNTTSGGEEGKTYTLESRQQMSAARKGKGTGPRSEAVRDACRKAAALIPREDRAFFKDPELARTARLKQKPYSKERIAAMTADTEARRLGHIRASKTLKIIMSRIMLEYYQKPDNRKKCMLGGHIAGTLNSHTRWHVNRGIINPNCKLCCPKNFTT